MNFVLWLVKRVWKPVVEYWGKPETNGTLSGNDNTHEVMEAQKRHKEMMHDLKHLHRCDGCAKETNDLTAAPIAGIGISHQCPKCTLIIEKYERRYQEGKTNEQ